MPSYRLYRLDGAGNISTAEWLEAADDMDAVEKARVLHPTGFYEVWNRDRLVVRIDAVKE